MLTSCHLVHLVLYEKVDERNECSEESSGEDLAVLDCFWVGRTQHQAACCPGYCSHQVGNHEDVMPVMVVSRSDIGPTSACQRSKDAHAGDEFGECRVGTGCEEVPKSD